MVDGLSVTSHDETGEIGTAIRVSHGLLYICSMRRSYVLLCANFCFTVPYRVRTEMMPSTRPVPNPR
jgi:hypothetical protein